MKKHGAYTEWADAYSCSRHRCQPGGRNLAVYTVGCKHVEAPESALECEEVVEDTNMQFPFCCTRLRCLVLVRGEVWTRVLGQPWETLPAAPWSHMYKMKKPPPSDDGPFLPKNPNEGPIYELTDQDGAQEKILRASKKTIKSHDFNATPRAVPAPDIFIALSTNSDQKGHNKEFKKSEKVRHKRTRVQPSNSYDDDAAEHHKDLENEELATEKAQLTTLESSEEKYKTNDNRVTPNVDHKNQHHQVAWTEIPQNQWNEDDPTWGAITAPKVGLSHENVYHQSEVEAEKKEEKSPNLQALVDAIGTRMRDIENVVQRMSEKVQEAKPGEGAEASAEKKVSSDSEGSLYVKHHKTDHGKEFKPKSPSPDAGHYKRFSVRSRSKYIHSTADATTEQPLFVEDTNVNGYFSDASNSVLRRSDTPKELAPTYMAPVETRRKSHASVSDSSTEVKTHKKHSHKKKRGKGKNHKKHHKDEKRKRLNRLNTVELDTNVVSLEDSSDVTAK
ncbi:uncharacterized protein LOC131852286 [Achroia grisella]|uniref:uncharacterized protein LOC131852286 n=1 Tax=Achroia grisella TaxID=688607 RepID=UPI0027D2CCB1|nr:uncharacterized protein LOC131852286 [Achroia grisella]